MSAVTVRALPAKCGDCLVIEYGDNGSRPFRILIDGGLKGSYDEGLGKYLAESPDQPTEFDIVVVSHIDLDHIEGVIEAIKRKQLTTDNFWFNGRDELVELIKPPSTDRGARQGDELTTLIPKKKRNPVTKGKAIVVPETGDLSVLDLPGGARCTLLSPSRDRLERLLKKWPEAEATRGDAIAGLAGALDEDDEDDEAVSRGAKKFGRDGSPANGSSIAFLLEVGDVKLLLTGDAYARELEATVTRLLGKRAADKLTVDLFKLSHHGSRQNMTDDLLKLIDPGQILICTDGSKFDHPDEDALKKVHTHYPDVPIHFTDNTDTIVERATSIGLTAPTPDQLPVELTFGTAAPSPRATANPPTVPSNVRSARRAGSSEGKQGVKISGGDDLNIKFEWGAGATTRGGASDDVAAQLEQHAGAKDGTVSVEVIDEAIVHEVEQRRSGTRGGVGEAGNVVIDVGRSDADEYRVVLVEENGQYGWFIPDADADRVELAATLPPPNARGRIADLVRRKVRVIAIKGLHKAAGAATKAAVGVYEQKRHPAGLRTWTPSNYTTKSAEPPDLTHFDRKDRALLIVHGFMGSIHGSFGFSEPNARRLSTAYGGRVIAYDHPTLTPSPHANAQDLLDRLGDNEMSLDILAHSRGGLVARELARLVEGTKIDVRSIVFVASPNGGTPMADPDRPSGLLDAVTNFVGYIPGTDGFALVLEMLADIVFKGALPGLEGLVAMQPTGDYLTDLNSRSMPDHIVLRSIAAEFEPAATAGFLQAKLDDGLDMYFGQLRNDRIVPTASPYVKTDAFQVRPGQRLVLDSARGVHHSSFWTDPRATRQLHTWLSADEDHRTTPEIPDSETDPDAEIAQVAETTSVATIIEGVKSLPETIRKQFDAIAGGAAKTATPPTGQRDAVIVLPGIMGSHLAVGNRTIWVDALRLTRGGLAELTYGGADVTPTGLNRTYVSLITQLAVNWDVHLFPYDWRDDIFTSAKRLDELVARLRKDHPTRGVNFVAHSMGGLVVRAFRASHRERWDALGDVEGAKSGRLVMLGTPNRGSYSIPMTLLGSELAVRGLAAIDRKHSKDEVAEIVAGFPGVYQMLPWAEGVEDDDWRKLYELAAWGGPTHIKEHLLTLARNTHEKLATDGVDTDRFCYVAGYGQNTPFRVKIGANGASGLRIGRFAMGDGRVAHRLGELDGMPMYYVDATHGGLIANPTVLDTIDDLIRDGVANTTELFLDKPPARRGVAGAELEMLALDEFDREPLAPPAASRGAAIRPPTSDDGRVMDDALSMLLGGATSASNRTRITVGVINASLEQTRYPVAVGHYARVPSEGAEGFLDDKLGGVLNARYRLGLNADDPGRAVVVGAPAGHSPGGAVVVGLGEFGLLTESILERGISDGVLRLARMRIEAGIDHTEPFGLASVLIGTPGRYGLAIKTSMLAILEGVIGALGQLGEDRPRHFNLEFIELYEQQADEAADALRDIRNDLDEALVKSIDLEIDKSVQARYGGRPGAPTHDASGRPWIRMVAKRESTPVDADDLTRVSPIAKVGVSVLARQAQADQVLHSIDLDKLREFVDVAISGGGAENVGQTLYELLLPHRVKLELSRSDNLHLLVDEDLGQLPWELLTARESGGPLRTALAMRAGFLRQLHSENNTRQGAARPVGLEALVIGDPPTDFPRLKGAREEANRVAKLLTLKNWDVTSHISEETDEPGRRWAEIDSLLHAAPYRVVHVAAHGIFEPSEPMRSGVVTGTGAHHRLTALDFAAMSVQPDLVFLNCCHLGRIAAADEKKTLASWDARLLQPSKLAATVATQLMRNGVKAVVVAGWEVDDGAAAAFSDKLYNLLLDAEPLGPAVRAARIEAYRKAQLSNTWGAYQCYGDPDFQLVTRSTPRSRNTVVSDNQLIQNLKILASDAGQADKSGLDQLSTQLEDLLKTCADRLGGAYVSLAVGDAYRAVGHFEKAADAYLRCFSASDGCGELRAIEQYANMLVRAAALDTQSVNLTSFETAISKLGALSAAVGETAERLSLAGSVYKKLAVVLSHRGSQPQGALQSTLPATAKEALDHAKRNYQAAHERTEKDSNGERLDSYSANVWLQLLYADSPADRDRGEHVELGERLLDAAWSAAETPTSFWDRAALGDALLTMALLVNDGTSRELITQAATRYMDAFENRSTFRERDSVRTHLDDLQAIFRDESIGDAPGLTLIGELRAILKDD